MKKGTKKSALYVVDFVVNIIVVVLVFMHYRSLYFTVDPDEFVFKAIMSGGGIPMIAAMVSIVCAVIELLYGIRRMKDTEVMSTVLKWPEMWAIFKVIILLVWLVTILLGINISSPF